MKLTLKNFRCYTNQVFDFDDDTITLISGPSGHGKTTILLAIQFALYGLSGHKYLISHNKSSCEVVLVYKNFKIKRTKRPNILNLEVDGKLYEDKEAQVIINKYFGTNNSSTFFMDMSHLEKMEFLEKIVNADCDVKELKMRIKSEISYLSKELAILDGQISNTESMLKLVQKPAKVEKPGNEIAEALKDLSKEELMLKKEQSIKQLERENLNKEECNALNVHLNVLRGEIASLGSVDPQIRRRVEDSRRRLAELEVCNGRFNKLRERFLVAEDALKELPKYDHANDDQLHRIEQRIQELDKKIDKCTILKDLHVLNNLETEYNEALDHERLEWQRRVDLIQDQLIPLRHTPKQDVSCLKQICAEFELVQAFNAKHDLDDIDEQIKALRLTFFKSYTCSNCNHKIVINMDTFEVVPSSDPPHTTEVSVSPSRDSRVDERIKERLQELIQLKGRVSQNSAFMQVTNIDEVRSNIATADKVTKLEDNLRQLGSFKASTTLNKMKKKIDKMKAALSSSLSDLRDAGEVSDVDVDTLKDERRESTIELNTLSQQLKVKRGLLKKIEASQAYDAEEHSETKRSIECCVRALQERSGELDKLKRKERLEDKIKSLKTQLDQLRFDAAAIPRLSQLLKDIDGGLEYHAQYSNYINFHVQLKKYKMIKDTLNNFITSKQKMEHTYLKTLLFKQKVIEAEHESLQMVVNTVNTHLAVLLEDFFSESLGDPIQIYLELKVVSETRPQVNMVINYKGNSVDYKSLSTGEYARVKLAFDLTFKEILGETIIMLDECTANLDQDLSTRIFDKIKASFPSKTILVVAHQVVRGTFDNVLTL